jgi:hypothetical protein
MGKVKKVNESNVTNKIALKWRYILQVSKLREHIKRKHPDGLVDDQGNWSVSSSPFSLRHMTSSFDHLYYGHFTTNKNVKLCDPLCA